MKIQQTRIFRICIHTSQSLIIFFFGIQSLYSQQIKDTSLTLYFNSGLHKPDSSQVNKIISFISSINGVKDIIGYTDTVGTIVYNRNLSRLRALSVYQIVSSRIRLEGAYSFKGEEFPRNSDLSLNRKVEIIGYKFVNRRDPKFGIHDEVVDSFNIENINFIPDRAILTPESIGSILRLVRKIKSYRAAYFQIIGHVNYQSKRDSSYLEDLYKLSEERAKVIYQILIENDVDKSFLKYKGVGNSQPLIKNPKNDEERMKNMRVQILVFGSARK